ncbi:hypothetical protein [Alloyangia pacifica]|uniref:hypothetical protein n=1 Tax=Alloyangia pacifica TaxID=311180 RepID=UPI00131F0408|nr:hypothetical protein [Alloyangia pacifica]
MTCLLAHVGPPKPVMVAIVVLLPRQEANQSAPGVLPFTVYKRDVFLGLAMQVKEISRVCLAEQEQGLQVEE